MPRPVLTGSVSTRDRWRHLRTRAIVVLGSALIVQLMLDLIWTIGGGVLAWGINLVVYDPVVHH